MGIKAWKVGYTSGLIRKGENWLFWLESVWKSTQDGVLVWWNLALGSLKTVE